MEEFKKGYIDLIKQAENQYKFIMAVSHKTHLPDGDSFYDYYPDTFSWANTTLTKEELLLNKEEEKLASVTLQNCAIYVLYVQLDKFLEIYCENRFHHEDTEIKNASIIIRQIRNAFAHNPLYPEWEIRQPEAKNKVLGVKDFIQIDFSKVDNKPVKRRDFGGPLSSLKLSEFIRGEFS